MFKKLFQFAFENYPKRKKNPAQFNSHSEAHNGLAEQDPSPEV